MKTWINLLLVTIICVKTSIEADNSTIDQMMKKICDIATKTLKIQNAEPKDKETIIKYMTEKLTKKSLELGFDSGAPIKLILQGISMLSDDEHYDEICAEHKVFRRSTKDNSIVNRANQQYVPNTRTHLENLNLSNEDKLKSVLTKIEILVENVINNASTFEMKRRNVENLKHLILDKFTRQLTKKEKNEQKRNEYRNLIANGIDMTVNRLIGNGTRRMSLDFFENAGEQIEKEPDLIAEEALAELTTKVTPTTATSQSLIGLTKDYGDGGGCGDVVKKICTELKYLDSYKCEYDGTTLSTQQVCNGVIDCPDGSDEKNCIQQVIAKVHSATQMLSKVELSRYCFKSLYENTIISRQGNLLSELLNSQIEFLKKYVLKNGKVAFPEMLSSTPMSVTRDGESLSKNMYHHEPNVDNIVGEVALVIRTFVTSLNSALCVHVSEEVMRAVDDVADPSGLIEQEFDKILEESNWSPSSCDCGGQHCVNNTCPPLCKRFCYQIYTLNRFVCKSVDVNGSSIPIDMICDGKLDCFEETDELNCADDNNLSKFEGNKIYNKVINMIKSKIYSKGYDLVRGPMIELQVHVQNIQKRSMSPKVNSEAFKTVRDTYFKMVKSIFVEMMDDSENLKRGEEVYEFFSLLNERIVEALKHTHTGNKKMISADDCFCRGSECAQAKCSARCVHSCTTKAAITNYACSIGANSVNTTAVPVDSICNGKINCPNGDDELNCRPEICRIHHARVLRHNIQAVGEKYKGSIVGHALDTWKAKVSSTLMVLEKRERLTPRILKNTVNQILHDLSLTYLSLRNYRRLDTGKILKKFIKLSQRLIESLKSCTK